MEDLDKVYYTLTHAHYPDGWIKVYAAFIYSTLYFRHKLFIAFQ